MSSHWHSTRHHTPVSAPPQQYIDDLVQLLAQVLVVEPAVLVEVLGGVSRRELGVEDARVAYAVLVDAGAGKLREASRSHVTTIRSLFEERYNGPEIETLIELLGRLPGAGGEPSCTL